MSRPGARKPAAERKKEDADAISYAFGHWIRLEALAVLAEGVHSVAEIARFIGVSVQRLTGHINGLYDHGCIEYMGEGTARNANEHYYRAVVLPRIDDETFRAMPPFERRDSLGLVAQAIFAESLASLRAGKLDDDANARVFGRCIRVDAQGKDEAQDHALETYEKLTAIKVKSAHRLAQLKESGTTTIVSVTAFERSRPFPISTEPESALEIAKARRPIADRKKDLVAAIAYACGNATRIAALEVLAEGTISVGEIAKDLDVDLKSLSDHIRFLYEHGSIEGVGIKKIRNTNKHFYRAITLPRISPKEYCELTVVQRREVLGLILQRIIAATLASFRGGQLEHDERVQLIWDALNLDEFGKLEVANCLAKADSQLLDIERVNSERLADAGREGIPMIATFVGFERSRASRPDMGYGSPRKL